MNAILVLVSLLIKHIAYLGAGFPSAGFSFQPTVPNELKTRGKQSNCIIEQVSPE